MIRGCQAGSGQPTTSVSGSLRWDAFRETLQASGYEPYLERPNPPGADLMFFEGPDGLHVEMTEPLSQ